MTFDVRIEDARWNETGVETVCEGGPPNNLDAGQDSFLGDIAISYETCLREAQETQKDFEHHFTHLLVHGLLHLLGFDHEYERDARIMEKIETEILGKMGIDAPY